MVFSLSTLKTSLNFSLAQRLPCIMRDWDMHAKECKWKGVISSSFIWESEKTQFHCHNQTLQMFKMIRIASLELSPRYCSINNPSDSRLELKINTFSMILAISPSSKFPHNPPKIYQATNGFLTTPTNDLSIALG